MSEFHKYTKTEYDGKVAYHKKINSKHIFRKYNGIAISSSALYQMEPDALILIEYIGKTEDVYFITYVRVYNESELEHDNDGDTQKIVPLYRHKKVLLRNKGSTTMDKFKPVLDSNKQIGLGEYI